MKLTRIFKSVAKAVQTAARAQQAQQLKTVQAQVRDAFESSRRAPVSLGKTPGASAAADAAYVQSLYRDLLGRAPDAAGFQSHVQGLENGMSRDEIRQVFLTSPEYREKLAAEAAAQTQAAQTQASGGGLGSSVGPVPLEGYDAGKLANPNHQTVKYLFGRVASHFSLDGVKDKAGAQALLERMKPELEKAGLQVHEVKGDKIRVSTELGQEWVDVVRGAGSGSPGWWWGSEGKAIAGTGGGAILAPGPGPTAPGAALSTVPMRPEYASAPIDRSSPAAAARSAAQWVKDTHPELFGFDDRQVAFEVMTHVLGAMRAHGFDAVRVVNHADRAVGDGWRYGSDAVAVGGRIYDVYGSFGAPGGSHVQALDVGAWDPSRARE